MQFVTLLLAILSSLLTVSWLIQYATALWPAIGNPQAHIPGQSIILFLLQLVVPAANAIFFAAFHRVLRGLPFYFQPSRAAYYAFIANAVSLVVSLAIMWAQFPHGLQAGLPLPSPYPRLIYSFVMSAPICLLFYFASQDWLNLRTRRILLTACVVLLSTAYSTLSFAWRFATGFSRSWNTQGAVDWSVRPLWTVWSYALHPALLFLYPAVLVVFLVLLLMPAAETNPSVEAH